MQPISELPHTNDDTYPIGGRAGGQDFTYPVVMRHLVVLVATSVAYASFAVVARIVVRPAAPTTHKSYLLAAHNSLLCLVSIILFFGTAIDTTRRIHREGFDWFFCERADDPALYRWLYFYYLSKYLELLDTILAVCLGRPPRHYWMHTYHHCYVLYMAYFYVDARQSLAVGGTLFNTFVHIPMYAYYARAALKLRTPWKAAVTRLQIVQFVTSFGLLVVALAKHPDLFFASSGCAGGRPLALNAVFNATLLVLFFRVLRGSRTSTTSVKRAA